MAHLHDVDKTKPGDERVQSRFVEDGGNKWRTQRLFCPLHNKTLTFYDKTTWKPYPKAPQKEPLSSSMDSQTCRSDGATRFHTW
jgi:hypothetical protein